MYRNTTKCKQHNIWSAGHIIVFGTLGLTKGAFVASATAPYCTVFTTCFNRTLHTVKYFKVCTLCFKMCAAHFTILLSVYNVHLNVLCTLHNIVKCALNALKCPLFCVHYQTMYSVLCIPSKVHNRD